MRGEEDIWINSERRRAEEYLQEQGVAHRGVGEYPAFHVHPYFALWAVQSARSPGWVGWWVATGDVPTDYISSSEARHPRVALRAIARQWNEVSASMLRGHAHPDICIGTPDQWPELAELLQLRAKILESFADDDRLWSEDLP